MNTTTGLDLFKLLAAMRAADAAASRDVLDLGCGPGFHTSALALHGPRVFGLDRQKLFSVEGAFTVGDVTRLPFAADRFDLLLAFDIIEHVPDVESLFSEMERVLRPGGRILVSVPSDGLVPRAWFAATLRRAPARIDPTHVRFLGYPGWRDLFAAHFAIEDAFGQWFTEHGERWKRMGNALLRRAPGIAPNLYFQLRPI